MSGRGQRQSREQMPEHAANEGGTTERALMSGFVHGLLQRVFSLNEG
jgi:hypothetical protein